MTSITSASSSSVWAALAAQGTQPPPPNGRAGGSDPIDSVTEVLGRSRDDITTALKSGQSLDDLATEAGVSHDDLIAALEDGLPTGATRAASGVDPTAMLEKLAATKGLPQPPSGPPPARPATSTADSGVVTGSLTSRQQQAVGSLADLLGTDSDGLLAELSGGSDLSDMLRDRGVTRAAAAATVGEGFLVDRTG